MAVRVLHAAQVIKGDQKKSSRCSPTADPNPSRSKPSPPMAAVSAGSLGAVMVAAVEVSTVLAADDDVNKDDAAAPVSVKAGTPEFVESGPGGEGGATKSSPALPEAKPGG